MLRRMYDLALTLLGGPVYKAGILTGFFAFLCLSNLCPHSLTPFDPSRHLTGTDLIFIKQYIYQTIGFLLNGKRQCKVGMLSIFSLSLD